MTGDKYYCFGETLLATADARINKPLILKLWQGFCSNCGSIKISEGPENSFVSGTETLPELKTGCEYSIKVSQNGIAIKAINSKALIRALMVLLMRIEAVDLSDENRRFRILACDVSSNYTVDKRMIHFCIFPETSLPFIKKCIRLAGCMQYTHVVLEFWGTLRYDCLKELSWEKAFTKNQVGELVQEISSLGMEAIPMFNHLGHASACRVSGGKHVVLDQNPALALLFSSDGWSWNIDNADAKALLRSIRGELYELFPNAEYIHLGCDEVYSYGKGEENQRRMRMYLMDIIEEVKAEKKKPIIWGDMLLNYDECEVTNPYFCSCDTPEYARELISSIPKDTIIADWHYDVCDTPIKTSLYLSEQGFRVLGAPWFETDNCRAYVETVKNFGLMGIMVTTWHTLAQHMPHIVTAAVLMGAYHSPWADEEDSRENRMLDTETATLLRKLMFVNGSYEESGWTDSQVFRQSRATV